MGRLNLEPVHLSPAYFPHPRNMYLFRVSLSGWQKPQLTVNVDIISVNMCPMHTRMGSKRPAESEAGMMGGKEALG